MADQQYIDCSNAEQSVEDLIRQVIRIDDNGKVFVNTNCTCGGGGGCDICLPDPGAESQILTVVGGVWAAANAPAGTLPPAINAGEVLTVSGGAWVSSPVPDELPAIGTAGNILTDSGAAWVSSPPASQLPSPASSGEVLTANGAAWVSQAVPTELPAAGTSGNLLTSNGATWQSVAPDTTLDLESVTFDSTPNADHTATGNLWAMTAAVNVDKGDACYVNSAGKMALCKADAIANCPHFWGVATEAISANNTGKFLTHGMLRDDTFNFTIGAVIWVSITGTTTNTLTEIEPSAANNVGMPIGVAVTADVLWITQNFTTVEHV